MRPPGRDIPAGTAVGIMLDHLLGEPPDRLHPVVYLGRGLAMLERRSYAYNRPAGVVHVAIAIAAAITAARTVERIAGREPAIALGVATASAGNMLGEVALDVQRQLEVGDLETARRTVRSLVGRTPDELEEAEVVRAVIESVAENTVDAVTATILWAAVCGPAGIWVHRTVNTLDAMVGHRSDRYLRFGWASARLDDMMNWFPARAAAVAVALVSPSRLLQTMKTVRRDGGQSSISQRRGGRVGVCRRARHHARRIKRLRRRGRGPGTTGRRPCSRRLRHRSGGESVEASYLGFRRRRNDHPAVVPQGDNSRRVIGPGPLGLLGTKRAR